MFCAARPTYVFYAVLRLLVPGAGRQVYEIKARCPINNLAAYCKKTYTQYDSYYLQQSDVYIHFKGTSLSSTCFHLMWSPKPNKEEEKNITSTLCLRPAPQMALMRKKTIQGANHSGLYQLLHIPPPLLSLLYSLLSVAVCVCRKNLQSLLGQLFIQNLVFFSQGCLLWSKAGSGCCLLQLHK